jgi:hypothetical protein
MKDFSLQYIVAKQLLEGYYKAMIAQDVPLAAKIANELVEMTLKLEDIAHDHRYPDTI